LARRARVHSRDVQLQIATPKGKFAAARVQRLDFPWSASIQNIDELGRKLRVGTTTDIPEVTVTFEAFDVSHNIYSYLTGYTPGTFPASGVSVTEFKNVDLIGQIRDTSSTNIVNAIYVKRGIVTGMDASFGVRDNSTVSYTVGANSKKEFKQPVFYEAFTASGNQATFTLSKTPSYLTRTSGYVINAYQTTALTNGGSYLNAGTDFNVTGSTITLTTTATENDIYWFTYCSSNTTTTFDALDTTAPAAIQGKYVPLAISVNNIPRVQSASIRASMQSETILEMGGLGQPVGYEIGIPDVTGDISVLKTDNELVSILEGTGTGASTPIEQDLEFALSTLPLKVQLKDPSNPTRVVLTYYIPSITISSNGDDSSVNQSMNETFAWSSTTGELFIASGNGPW
jgi:hypothetical protein